MAKNRYINTKIWEDAWFNDLDPIEKLFFIYLLTNPMTNILGVYELSKGTIGRATGLEARVVDEILSRFERDEKVYYRDGWVVISNFIKHQNYRSPKILAGLEAEAQNIPKNILKFVKSPVELYGIDTVSHSNLIKFNSNYNSNSNSKNDTPSKCIQNGYKTDTEVSKEKTPAQKCRDFFNMEDTSVLDEFKGTVPEDTLKQESQKFILYWTEPNKSGTKQRWELEKTFDVKRRFATWLSRAGNYKQGKKRTIS